MWQEGKIIVSRAYVTNDEIPLEFLMGVTLVC